jgi:hypothetical protein
MLLGPGVSSLGLAAVLCGRLLLQFLRIIVF